MTLVVGTDEAGYGPNLGPLVVAATAWEAAGDPGDVEASFARAHKVIGPLWGDSKRIFRGGDGLSALERGVLAAVAAAMGSVPATHASLAVALGGEFRGDVAADALPRACRRDDCDAASAAAARGLAAAGLTLVAVRCRVIEPREFNGLLDAGLNKSDILSQATLELAAALLARGPRPAVVWCDRHGGRRRYASLVSRALAAPLVQVVEELPERSAYVVPVADCRLEFSVGGESRLPVAVASMTAKYVRELAMAAFNTRWESLQPGLRPTAGYPVDAARWRRDAAATVAREGIPWDDLWRRA
ncbi:MAG: hypothetical protein ACKOC8_05020 [Pirellulales bacterium]